MPSRVWSERILFLLGIAILAMPFLGFPSIFKTIFFVVSGVAIVTFTLLVRISDYRQMIIEEEVVLNQSETMAEPNLAVDSIPVEVNTPVSALFVAESETVLKPTRRPRKTTIRRKTSSSVNPSPDHESMETF